MRNTPKMQKGLEFISAADLKTYTIVEVEGSVITIEDEHGGHGKWVDEDLIRQFESGILVQTSPYKLALVTIQKNVADIEKQINESKIMQAEELAWMERLFTRLEAAMMAAKQFQIVEKPREDLHPASSLFTYHVYNPEGRLVATLEHQDSDVNLYGKLLRLQGQSVDYALNHNGWKVTYTDEVTGNIFDYNTHKPIIQ